MKIKRVISKTKSYWRRTKKQLRKLKKIRKALRKKPRLYLILLALFGFSLFLLINLFVQTYRKPAEIVGVADAAFYKTPDATWEAYAHLFERHATQITTPEFLAALAQVESEGNPIARSPWVWRWSANPLLIYGPPSSSTGMYQMTHGNFEQAKKLCIHKGKVVQEGRWYELQTCWFNGFYNRLVPSHAIEMTSAYLTAHTQKLLNEANKPYPQKKIQRLAAAIHLCGPGRANNLLQREIRVRESDRCGSHSLSTYISRIEKLMQKFQTLRKK